MQTNELILALYPNSAGMGYVICENPKELIGYGVARIKMITKDVHLKRLEKFFDDEDYLYSNMHVRILKRLSYSLGVIPSMVYQKQYLLGIPS